MVEKPHPIETNTRTLRIHVRFSDGRERILRPLFRDYDELNKYVQRFLPHLADVPKDEPRGEVAVTAGSSGEGRLAPLLPQCANETVRALFAAVLVYSADTADHGLRVSRYAVELARVCGLDHVETDALAAAGLVHDVGKIALPQTLLSSPNPLTEWESEILRTHPEIGYRLLEVFDNLRGIATVVRHHHEWWNGAGYSQGLCGTDIPLGSRIIAIADAFDAMTSPRPYRDAMLPHTALANIRAGAGTQFDPDLAAAFVNLMNAKSVRRSGAGHGAVRARTTAGD